MVHRKTYDYWILEVTTLRKREILRPNLYCSRIWKESAGLPRPDVKKLDPSKDVTCQICHQHPETDEHLTIQCPKRHIVWSWLEGTIRQMGCKSSKEDLIRGHFGPIAVAKAKSIESGGNISTEDETKPEAVNNEGPLLPDNDLKQKRRKRKAAHTKLTNQLRKAVADHKMGAIRLKKLHVAAWRDELIRIYEDVKDLHHKYIVTLGGDV
ncbi:hypothetical protein OUZ56_018355 [Daphnia magna]|uniref:Reverse transcriptase zinc-binding domain-containing protein n=1 Tax=Daphnia magna TaxID=35525 RepID=A0ABQ9Z8L1_9CRUS|nr:hypothetical protein OUZ56_018355 [Daphnia magna]